MSLKIKATQASFFTLFSSPKKKTVSKAKEIQELFAKKSPKNVLGALKSKGYDAIDECHCCPQFSRSTLEAHRDIREIAETALVDAICKDHSDKEKPLTICSLATGSGFADLVLLSKLRAKGYRNISWILVDPTYSGKNGSDTLDQGQRILAQFKELADYLCPGIKIQTIDFLDELDTIKLIDTPDVVWDFDDGMLGTRSQDEYEELQKELKKWIDSRNKPILFLHSEKSRKMVFSQKEHCILPKFHVEVFLDYFLGKGS